MAWTDDLLGQRIFVDGTELLPTKKAWDFLGGTNASYNSVTDRVEIAIGGGGFDWQESCRLATTANLVATRIGSVLTADANGAIGNIDGVAVAVGDRVLVKNQAAPADNGIYVWNDLGSGSTPYVLTRDTLADETGEITPGLRVVIEEGTVAGQQIYQCSNTGTVTMNVTAITFAFAGSLSLVTAAAPGTVNLLGAANTVLTTDGATPGGAWATIADANVGAGAAIAVTKLAFGAANQVVKTNAGATALEHGLLANANVDAAAAIAGSKVDPDFGAQSIVTTGDASLGTTPADAGVLRMPNNTDVNFRNAGNSANILGMKVSGTDQLELGDDDHNNTQINSSANISFWTTSSPRAEVNSAGIRLDAGDYNWNWFVANPQVQQSTDATAAITGEDLVVKAQNCSDVAATGGSAYLQGGTGGGTNGIAGIRDTAGTDRVYVDASADIWLDSADKTTIRDAGSPVAEFAATAVTIFRNSLQFDSTTTPVIDQETQAGAGGLFTLSAQDSSGNAGGDLDLKPGSGATTGGQVALQTGAGADVLTIDDGQTVNLPFGETVLGDTADSFGGTILMEGTSTSNNPVTLTLVNGGGDGIPIPTDTTMFFDVLVCGTRTDNFGTSASYTMQVQVENAGGTSAEITAAAVTVVLEQDASWNCTFAVSDAEDEFKITCTGSAGGARTFRWTAKVEYVAAG
jgi:hypothetical protein